jgi:hypothetical protein
MHKLAVKLEGIERRKRTTGLLHVAAAFFLLLKSLDYLGLQHVPDILILLPYFFATVASLVYGLLKKFLDPQAKYNAWVRLLQVCVFTLLALDFIPFGKTVSVVVLFAWAVGCLLLMFTERKVFHDAEMIFHSEGIFIPGYFTNRRLFWRQVKEVVVRPDYITIFQADDRFLQYEVLKNMEVPALNEIALYCKQQIQATTQTA